MDTTDSTFSEAPLLDDAVGTADEYALGDLDQITAEADPQLGDLDKLDDDVEILAADEAIPVLSELVSPSPPSEVSSRLSEPQTRLDAANQPEDALSSALDDLLGEQDSALPTQEPDTAVAPPPSEPAPPPTPLDGFLGDGPEPPEAATPGLEGAPLASTMEEDLEDTTDGDQRATAATGAEEAPPADTAYESTYEEEPPAVEDTAPPLPDELPAEAGPSLAEEAAAGPDDASTTDLETALDTLLGEETPAGETTTSGFTVTEAPRDSAVDTDLAGLEPPAEPDDSPLGTPATAATTAAAAATLPQLRERLEAHLAQRMDEVLNETVALMAQELEGQIVERVEQALMEALESALPRLMEQFTLGLREEIQPRLRTQIPRLMAEILGKDPQHD